MFKFMLKLENTINCHFFVIQNGTHFYSTSYSFIALKTVFRYKIKVKFIPLIIVKPIRYVQQGQQFKKHNICNTLLTI